MVYRITFERKSDPSIPGRSLASLIWVEAKDYPAMDKVQWLLSELHGDDVEKSTVKITEDRNVKKEEWEGRIYNL